MGFLYVVLLTQRRKSLPDTVSYTTSEPLDFIGFLRCCFVRVPLLCRETETCLMSSFDSEAVLINYSRGWKNYCSFFQ
jgi:hypothetical protein